MVNMFDLITATQVMSLTRTKWPIAIRIVQPRFFFFVNFILFLSFLIKIMMELNEQYFI